jgi:hypothetical protein
MVERIWPGETFFILGGGPSLTQDDVLAVQGYGRVIAVNDAYRLAPNADVLYGCDAKWWAWHHGVPTFSGLKFALEAAAGVWPGVEVLRNTGYGGLEPACDGLRNGRNSGYQAINLAVHLGAAKIVLLGFDMGPHVSGRTHWFGEHPEPMKSPYDQMLALFETLVDPLKAAGVEIVNCSRRTRLNAFRIADLETVLQEVAA